MKKTFKMGISCAKTSDDGLTCPIFCYLEFENFVFGVKELTQQTEVMLFIQEAWI